MELLTLVTPYIFKATCDSKVDTLTVNKGLEENKVVVTFSTCLNEKDAKENLYTLKKTVEFTDFGRHIKVSVIIKLKKMLGKTLSSTVSTVEIEKSDNFTDLLLKELAVAESIECATVLPPLERGGKIAKRRFKQAVITLLKSLSKDSSFDGFYLNKYKYDISLWKLGKQMTSYSTYVETLTKKGTCKLVVDNQTQLEKGVEVRRLEYTDVLNKTLEFCRTEGLRVI